MSLRVRATCKVQGWAGDSMRPRCQWAKRVGEVQDCREKLTQCLTSNTASISQSQLRWITNGKVRMRGGISGDLSLRRAGNGNVMAGWGGGLMRRGTLKLVTRKAARQALGGRVLIGGWARAARQGSKLWEARVEPPVDPGTSDSPGIIQQRCTSFITGHTLEARNMLFSRSRCQTSFPIPISN